jgi:hypothetical protein
VKIWHRMKCPLGLLGRRVKRELNDNSRSCDNGPNITV